MTYYVILGLALALAGAGCLVRRRAWNLGNAMIVGGCLGAVGCLAWQVRQTMFSPAVAGPDRGQAVVGYFLANRVMGDLREMDGPIVLLFPPESVIDAETAGVYAGTFARVLRGVPGLKVQSVTLSGPAKNAKAGPLPLAAFRQALSNGPTPVAYVSFAGVPADIASLMPANPQSHARFFVFDPWSTTNWVGALKAGVVRCVIVPRPGMKRVRGEDVSGEPNEVFNQLYLMATPESADDVASRLGPLAQRLPQAR